MPRLTVSIVNFNCSDETIAAVCSIIEHTKNIDYKIYVVDNASREEEVARLKEIEDEHVVVIRNEKNIGFGLAHNLAIELSNSEFHAVVNPDIILFEDSLTLLSEAMVAENAVMATCKLIFVDGSPQYTPKLSPTPLSLISRQLGILPEIEKKYLMLDRDLDKTQEISFCTGCFFIAKTKELKAVKGFSDRYFLYFEDADITRLMLKKGSVKYLPVTTVQHLWQRKPRKKINFFFLQLFSMFTFFVRWGIVRPKIYNEHSSSGKD